MVFSKKNFWIPSALSDFETFYKETRDKELPYTLYHRGCPGGLYFNVSMCYDYNWVDPVLSYFYCPIVSSLSYSMKEEDTGCNKKWYITDIETMAKNGQLSEKFLTLMDVGDLNMDKDWPCKFVQKSNGVTLYTATVPMSQDEVVERERVSFIEKRKKNFR